jgi:hypothetical protein
VIDGKSAIMQDLCHVSIGQQPKVEAFYSPGTKISKNTQDAAILAWHSARQNIITIKD